MIGKEPAVTMHLTLWYVVLVCHQYNVCKHYFGNVYGGLRESEPCVFRELSPVSFLVVGERPSVCFNLYLCRM